jgi:hypothetical protein
MTLIVIDTNVFVAALRSGGGAARQVVRRALEARYLQRFRLFGQLPGRNKLKGAGSRLLVSPFPEIKFILSCCGVL